MVPKQTGEKGKPPGEIWRWPLPQEVCKALGDPLTTVKNPLLLLRRYVPYRHGRDTHWEWTNDSKPRAWKLLCAKVADLYAGEDYSRLLQEVLTRMEEAVQALGRQGCKVEILTGKVVWRTVVGLGLTSPLETGFTLHTLYGIPFLPATALKGVTRAYRLQAIAEEFGIPRLRKEDLGRWTKTSPTPWQRLEELLMSPFPSPKVSESEHKTRENAIRERYKALEKAMEEAKNRLAGKGYSFDRWDKTGDNREKLITEHVRDFSRAFGSQEARGEILFLDAYPVSLTVDEGGRKSSILELDVMTPHYQDYYTKDQPPADWMSPVPVQFLAVRRGASFRIVLAHCPSPEWGDDDLLDKVANWTKEALRQIGIGAKTRAGYGELEVRPYGS